VLLHRSGAVVVLLVVAVVVVSWPLRMPTRGPPDSSFFSSFFSFWALVVLIPERVHACDFLQPACGARAPGDVVLGILLPSHRTVKALEERVRPESFNCSE